MTAPHHSQYLPHGTVTPAAVPGSNFVYIPPQADLVAAQLRSDILLRVVGPASERLALNPEMATELAEAVNTFMAKLDLTPAPKAHNQDGQSTE